MNRITMHVLSALAAIAVVSGEVHAATDDNVAVLDNSIDAVSPDIAQAATSPEVIRSDANPATAATPIPEPSGTTLHGYMRAGVTASEGHSPACYKLAGAITKYRFGNECDNYGSLTVEQKLYKFSNNMQLSGVAQVELDAPVDRIPRIHAADSNAKVRLPQSYLQLSDIPGLPGARAFLGRINYHQVDVHTIDYSYWNPAGLGAGIDNIPIGGSLKLSYALFREDSAGVPNYATRHDLELSGIHPNKNGELSFGLSYIPQRAPIAGAMGLEQETHGGWSLTAQHFQTELLGGKNKLALQYGVGPGTGLSSTGPLTNDGRFKSVRLLDTFDWQATRNYGGQLLGLYERDIAPTGSQTWISVGARQSYAFTTHIKGVVDFGHDLVAPDGGPTRNLNKFTLAAVLAKDRAYWSRPELRLFYTYAHWNKAAQNAAAPGDALSTTGTFGSSRSGSTVGLQLETWF